MPTYMLMQYWYFQNIKKMQKYKEKPTEKYSKTGL